MIHLPGWAQERRKRELLGALTGDTPTKQLSREEAQDVVDAATAILDGLKVLFVLADQGNAEAKLALRQWRDVLGQLGRL